MLDLSTEKTARKALKSVHSPAANAKTFTASRRGTGWLFAWNPDAGDAPLFTYAWLVADSGAIHMITTDPDVQGIVVEALLSRRVFTSAPSGRRSA